MTTALQARSLVPTLTANDLERSLRFYEGLGFRIQEKMEEGGKLLGVMMEAGGGAVLGISQDDFSKGKDRVKGVGMRLYLETDQDIESLAKQASAAGVSLDQGPAPLPWGPMAFTATDPDGFRITISKPSQ